MSPIRPEDRDRYPADWPEIRARILERAGGRCECWGRCGHDHTAERRGSDYGYYDDARACWMSRCEATDRGYHPVTKSRVVLTVAHLDHTPEHNDPSNLLAMCQRCHLAYDREHHAETRARTIRTEREAAGQTVIEGAA